MALIELHRTKERSHLSVPLRVERLEEDADTHDAIVQGMSDAMRTINARLTGILASLVVASIMLALNLVVHK